jgi:hypothetical protein
MRRLLVILSFAGALALPASASALEFQVRGVEVRVTPATFVGAVFKDGVKVGSFYTEVPHSSPLSSGATICPSGSPCGVYLLSTASGIFTGRYLGGAISPPTTVADLDGCPDKEFAVTATLTSGGSASAVLHHFNKFPSLGCPTIAASIRGIVRDP